MSYFIHPNEGATEDKRVRRSKRLLGEALLDLLHTRRLNQISIRDVTDHADVGYMTFYRHYASIADLLTDYLRGKVSQQITQMVIECDQQAPLIFAHIQQNEHLYRALLMDAEASRARDKLEVMLADFYMLTALETSLISAELRARHMTAAAMSLVKYWLERDKSMSVETFTHQYNTLVIEGNIDEAKMRALVMQHG
jgi:AcrR family transcriptional regulator